MPLQGKFTVLIFTSTQADHTPQLHMANHCMSKAAMPTKVYGQLYLPQSCHARGTDPFAVFVLCDHCIPAILMQTCRCAPPDLGNALHCVVSMTLFLSPTGLLEVDHGRMVQ